MNHARRQVTRRDGNEAPLVGLARRLGVQMEQDGPLDWWAGWRGVWLPIEIKEPHKEGWRDEYTPAQKRFHERCKLHRSPHLTWRTEADVFAFVGARASA